jgi:hypothetical protein
MRLPRATDSAIEPLRFALVFVFPLRAIGLPCNGLPPES